MGIFNNIFSNNKEKVEEKSTINWIPLTSLTQLDEIVKKSKDKQQAIFKHSTRCHISKGVMNQFERSVDTDKIDFYYLDLLSYRGISNEIAARFQVLHQSPQLLLIEDGVVVAHDSHYDIMSLKIT